MLSCRGVSCGVCGTGSGTETGADEPIAVKDAASPSHAVSENAKLAANKSPKTAFFFIKFLLNLVMATILQKQNLCRGDGVLDIPF
jgi:hypothetical protein